MRRADEAYGRGAWAEAEALCREVLAAKPDHADALNLLGVLAAGAGRVQEAAELFGRGAAASPDNERMWFHHGVMLQQLGRPEAALASYAQAIALNPGFAEAHYNRGGALQVLGRPEDALEGYAQALRLQPEFAEAHYNRGTALQELGRLQEALEGYEQALRLKPDIAMAWINRANVLYALGRLEEALASCDGALRIEPGSAEAHYNRGNVLRALERPDDSLASYDRALQLRPDYAEAGNNRGNALHALGRLEEALAGFESALRITPEYAESWSNRGNTLQELGRLEEALASHDRALQIRPDYAEAHYNRGNVLHELRRPDEALASYDRAVALAPALAEAISNRGNVLRDLRRCDEALASCDAAIAIRPDLAGAWFNRGNVLGDLGRSDEALASYDRAIVLEPALAEALFNRGYLLQKLKRHGEALASYEQAAAIRPDLPYLPGSRLHARMHICDWDEFDETASEVMRAVESGKKAVSPFDLLALPSSPAQQQRCARIYTEDKFPDAAAAVAWGGRSARSRIRLGYYSSDFHEHATAYLIAELFELHDRERFELVAFSFGPDSNDGWRRRIVAASDQFIDVRARSDREIALRSREMAIDVAVDLKGLTQDNRLGIFAMRAAPVQVGYLGFPGTAGAEYLDYLIADETLIPEESRKYYSEKIAYLPDSYQVNDRMRPTADRTFSRAELGLPESGFVFCCFNNNYKFNPATFSGWMRILRGVQGSVLWLLEDNATAAANLRKEARARDVDGERLVFARRVPVAEHLARHRAADLFLDTLPYNAHTTASDALWTGLPLLTCMGESFAGRVAASLLKAVGLPELITATPEQYESVAVALGNDARRLARIRETLARNRRDSPLFDTARFTKHIEAAYAAMHERSRAGLPPRPIRIEA
jgi:predicted O-linked N-acetylglucosamine transferase (SPINDLY family)